MQVIKYLTPWHEYCEELEKSKLDWEKDAPCKVQGPKRMYPPSDKGQKVIAHDVCGGCTARTQCLNLALVTKEEYGVWGGTTEKARDDMYRQLNKVLDLSNKYNWRDNDVKSAVYKCAEAFASMDKSLEMIVS